MDKVTVLLDADDFQREMKTIFPKESLTIEQFSYISTLPEYEAIKYIMENASCVNTEEEASIYYDLYIS